MPFDDTTGASSKSVATSPPSAIATCNGAEGCGRPGREPQARVTRHARAWPAPPTSAFPRFAQKGLEHGGSIPPNLIWQSDTTKLWAGTTVGWAYLVSVLDFCTREIFGGDLSLRCRRQDALTASN